MGARVIPRGVVRSWLENYHALAASDVVDGSFPSNTGPKAYDGVSSRHLNFLMLEAAIAELPLPIRGCVVGRWVERHRMGELLRLLKISKSTYYERCDQGVDLIYHMVNGQVTGYLTLMGKIKGLDKRAEESVNFK